MKCRQNECSALQRTVITIDPGIIVHVNTRHVTHPF